MRRSLLQAFLFAFLLAVLGEGLTLLMHRLNMPWAVAEFSENIITGLAAGGVVFLYMEERRRRIESRMEELAYLNHHIRNALTAIMLAPYAATEDMRLTMIKDASARIEKAIRRMSEQEHVSLADSAEPTVP